MLFFISDRIELHFLNLQLHSGINYFDEKQQVAFYLDFKTHSSKIK